MLLALALLLQEWTPIPNAVVEKREKETVVTFKQVDDLCELHFMITVDKLQISMPKDRPKPPEVKTASIGEFKITYYWIVYEEDFTEAADTAILDPDGRELARVSAKFAKQLRVEGTGRLKDGRVVNVSAGAKDRYEVTSAPFGLGTKGYHLVPFKSIAVDPEVVPMGSRIYIKEFEGLKLPDGSTHDGWFVAHDIGGAIKGRHIDVFALRESHWKKVFGKLKASLELFKVTE